VRSTFSCLIHANEYHADGKISKRSLTKDSGHILCATQGHQLHSRHLKSNTRHRDRGCKVSKRLVNRLYKDVGLVQVYVSETLRFVIGPQPCL